MSAEAARRIGASEVQVTVVIRVVMSYTELCVAGLCVSTGGSVTELLTRIVAELSKLDREPRIGGSSPVEMLAACARNSRGGIIIRASEICTVLWRSVEPS